MERPGARPGGAAGQDHARHEESGLEGQETAGGANPIHAVDQPGSLPKYWISDFRASVYQGQR